MTTASLLTTVVHMNCGGRDKAILMHEIAQHAHLRRMEEYKEQLEVKI